MKEVFEKQVIVEESPPEILNFKNVVYYSEHFKKLQGAEHGKAIQTKAKIFLRNNCIEYDPQGEKYGFEKGEYEGHKFICKPLQNYNKTTYRMWHNSKIGEFECSCQFYQKTKLQCSHVTALWMFIKILNWKKQHEKTNE